MAEPIPCRMLQSTDLFQRSLRRFTYTCGGDTRPPCTGAGRASWGHDASVEIDIIEIPNYEFGGRGIMPGSATAGEPEANTAPAKDDERWPAKCAHCTYEFSADDEWQVNDDRILLNATSRCTMRTAPPGSMWFAPWYDSAFRPQLEHCLVVVLPGGFDWCVDSQASNCTMKEDHAQEKHHCWTIEGTLPNITVGKRQPTCAAGAGSIVVTGWHGFLRNGALVEC